MADVKKFSIALFSLVLCLPGEISLAAEQQVPIGKRELGFSDNGSLGPFYYIGGTSSEVKLNTSAKMARLETPTVASMTDGGWLRWKVQDPFAETLSLSWIQVAPAGRDAPAWSRRPRHPHALPRMKKLRGCRLTSFSARPSGRFLGLFDCKGATGPILATLGEADETGSQPIIKLASLKMHFDAIDVTLSPPHSDGAIVVLAAYDPATHRLSYAQLFWPMTKPDS